MSLQKLAVIENNLLPLVIITTIIGLFLPQWGPYFNPLIGPFLALLMLFISLTFDYKAVKQSLKQPKLLFIATFLVYGPMAILGLLYGKLFFTDPDLQLGQALVGAIPTDVSAPLLVLLGGGSVALAAVMNAINTALAPFILPPLLLLLTGVEFKIPIESLILELCLIILIPMVIGVFLRSKWEDRVSKYDPVYSAASSLLYLILLFAVVTGSAELIKGYYWYGLVILFVQLLLNLSGYIIAHMTNRVTKINREDQIAFLFTVSKKEFSIAAAVVYSGGLPEAVVIPAVFYALLQMITSPLVVMLLQKDHVKIRKAQD